MGELLPPARRVPVSQVFNLAIQHMVMAKSILKKRAELEPSCGTWANMLFRTIDFAIHCVHAWENPKYLDERLATWEQFALLCPKCDYVFRPDRAVAAPVACPECNDVFLVGPADLPTEGPPRSPLVDGKFPQAG